MFIFVFPESFSQEKFTIYFDFAKEHPNDKSFSDLEYWLTKQEQLEILEIHGFCDSIDSHSYNKILSEKRIASVEKTLQKHEVFFNPHYTTSPFGKDFEQSNNPELNRKVEIFYRYNQIPIEAEKKPLVKFNNLEHDTETVAEKIGRTSIGEYVVLNNILFNFNSDVIMEKSTPALKSLYFELQKNPNLKIEIHGHICCNPDTTDVKLSQKRAKSIYKYLVKNGINKSRLAYKGFGSSKPIYKIPEKMHQESVANRRVEILILDK